MEEGNEAMIFMRPIDVHTHPNFNNLTVPNGFLRIRVPFWTWFIQFLSRLFRRSTYSEFLNRFNDYPQVNYDYYESVMTNYFNCSGQLSIALPLDFKHNGGIKGKLYKNYEIQLLDTLALSSANNRRIIVFDYVTNKNPRSGVKVYPSLCRLYPEQLITGRLLQSSIITHCEGGRVRASKTSRVEGDYLNDPIHWSGLLKANPELRLCFAHFGGEEAWWEYVINQSGWIPQIIKYMLEYPSVYVDLSDAITYDVVLDGVIILLNQYPQFKRRILFGTDWPMISLKKDGLKRTLENYNKLNIWEEMHENALRFLPEV